MSSHSIPGDGRLEKTPPSSKLELNPTLGQSTEIPQTQELQAHVIPDGSLRGWLTVLGGYVFRAFNFLLFD